MCEKEVGAVTWLLLYLFFIIIVIIVAVDVTSYRLNVMCLSF